MPQAAILRDGCSAAVAGPAAGAADPREIAVNPASNPRSFASPSPRPFTVVSVTYRPLAIVSGLTLGDYLLWDWSLKNNHDVLAVVAGLTLPPLALAWLWLIAVTLVRLTARTTRRSSQRAAGRRARSARAPLPDTAEPADAARYGEEHSAPAGAPAPTAEQPSRRIAA